MAEGKFWVEANYRSNVNFDSALTVEAPAYLRHETIKDVIDFLLSPEVKNEVERGKPETAAIELEIIEEIKTYMKGYNKAKSERMSHQMNLIIELKTKDGTLVSEGNQYALPNLEKRVKDFIIPETVILDDKSKVQIEKLTMIFNEVPWIGCDYK